MHDNKAYCFQASNSTLQMSHTVLLFALIQDIFHLAVYDEDGKMQGEEEYEGVVRGKAVFNVTDYFLQFLFYSNWFFTFYPRNRGNQLRCAHHSNSSSGSYRYALCSSDQDEIPTR